MHSSLVIITTIICLLLPTETLNASEEKLLKSPSQGWHLEDSWPVRFATNCAGYLWVAVPLALVVTLAKRGYLSEGKNQHLHCQQTNN